MERLGRIASHEGIVQQVRPRRVTVRIEAVSACASCAAHGKCGFAESKDKIIEVPTVDWQQFNPGETVIVNIDENRGMLAVWIAYVLPALLLLSTIVGLSLAHLPEWTVVLSSFFVLVLYILFLYLFRHKVESHFTLTITHHP